MVYRLLASSVRATRMEREGKTSVRVELDCVPRKESVTFRVYRCPACNKIMAVGLLRGRIKCKRCGAVCDLDNLISSRVEPIRAGQ